MIMSKMNLSENRLCFEGSEVKRGFDMSRCFISGSVSWTAEHKDSFWDGRLQPRLTVVQGSAGPTVRIQSVSARCWCRFFIHGRSKLSHIIVIFCKCFSDAMGQPLYTLCTAQYSECGYWMLICMCNAAATLPPWHSKQLHQELLIVIVILCWFWEM